jgi:hypothetical protein
MHTFMHLYRAPSVYRYVCIGLVVTTVGLVVWSVIVASAAQISIMDKQSIIDNFNIVKLNFALEFHLKQEQVEVIWNILNKRDAMGILPTGFGKSMLYIIPPLILDIVSIT